MQNTTNTSSLAFLAQWECNYYDDSDFWALAWNVDTKEFVRFSQGSTRYAGCDVTPVRPITDAERAEARAALVAILEAHAAAKAAQDRENPTEFERNERVEAKRVFRSRKTGDVIQPGATGSIFWSSREFLRGKLLVRVGVAYDDGRKLFHDGNVVRRAAARDHSHLISLYMKEGSEHWRAAVDLPAEIRQRAF